VRTTAVSAAGIASSAAVTTVALARGINMAGIIVTQSLVAGQTFATAVNKGPTVVTPAVLQVQLFRLLLQWLDGLIPLLAFCFAPMSIASSFCGLLHHLSIVYYMPLCTSFIVVTRLVSVELLLQMKATVVIAERSGS